MKQTILNVIEWAEQRNLIAEKNSSMQFVKIVEELGELAKEHTRGGKNLDMIMDAIGDILVTLIIYAEDIDLAQQLNIQAKDVLEAALNKAYNEIKERQGELVNGSFVKYES